jgi:hypothetical protein
MRKERSARHLKRMPIEEKAPLLWLYSFKVDVYNRLYCLSSALSASSAVNLRLNAWHKEVRE